MAEIHNTDARCQVKKLDALVGGNERTLAFLKDMLCETANSLCNVLFTESRCIEVGGGWLRGRE